MNIHNLGTGMVGRILAPRLEEVGHEVTIETRDPEETSKRTVQDGTFADWIARHDNVELAKFGDSCGEADIIINATNGKIAIEALNQVGEEGLEERRFWTSPIHLDFSQGTPPSLFVSNTDSLAEQIQRAFPKTHVVKSLNTLTASLMLNPEQLPGDHVVFVCGNNEGSKETVKSMLESTGWRSNNIIDLGDLTGSRGMEQSLPLWLRIWGSLGTVEFNFNIVRKA